MTSQQKRVFTSLFTTVFAVTLGFAVVNPFFPLYAQELTGRGIMVALVFSGFFLAKIIATPLMGRCSDGNSRKGIIIAGLIIHTLVAFIFFFLPRSLILLIVLRFLQGIATAMVRPVAQALVGDISENDHVASSMGTFDISFYAALALGPIIGGGIGDILGYRGMFLTLVILCLIALCIFLFTETDDRRIREHRTLPHTPYHDIFSNHTLQGLFCFILARSFSIIVISIFVPILIDTYFQPGYLGIGVCIAAGSITTALLLRPVGLLSDLCDQRVLVIAGGVMTGIFLFLIPFADTLGTLILINIVLALSGTLSLPATTALLIEEGRHYGLGYTMGIFHSIMNVGFFIGPILGGILMDIVGLPALFPIAGILLISGTLFFALRSPRIVEEEVCS